MTTPAGNAYPEIPGTGAGDTEELSDLVAAMMKNPAGRIIIGAVTSIASAITQGVSSTLSGLAQWAARLRGDVDRHENDLIAISDEQAAMNELLVDLAEIAATDQVTPLWAADSDDLTTFPRSQWVPITAASTGSESAGSGGSSTLHSHRIPTERQYLRPQADTFNATGSVYYTPIVADRRGVPTKMSIIAGGESGVFDIDAFFLGLGVYDPDNQMVMKVWDSGNIRNALPSTMQEFEVTTGLAVAATNEIVPGQLLFAMHLQHAPGLVQSTRKFAWIEQAGIARPSSRLVRGTYYRAPGQATLPNAYPLAQLAMSTNGIPWHGLHLEQVPS